MSNQRVVSRRALLATGAAALALGAAGTETANLATRTKNALSSTTTSSSTTPPDVDLMAEHGVLKRVLLIYQEAARRMEAGQPAPVSAVHSGAVIIHDFIESFHEALEEGYVFPRLRAAGELIGTVDTLLVQHARGREITQMVLTDCNERAMSSTSTRQRVLHGVNAFTRMYEPHEAREDTVVFPAFRSLLSASELDELGQRFASLQRSQFGPDAFTKVVEHVAAIEKSLGTYDLAEFTPQAVTP